MAQRIHLPRSFVVGLTARVRCHYAPLGSCTRLSKRGSNYCPKHDRIMVRRYEGKPGVK